MTLAVILHIQTSHQKVSIFREVSVQYSSVHTILQLMDLTIIHRWKRYKECSSFGVMELDLYLARLMEASELLRRNMMVSVLCASQTLDIFIDVQNLNLNRAL